MRRFGAILWVVCVVILGIVWVTYAVIGPRAFHRHAGRNGAVVLAVLMGVFLLPLGIATIAAGIRTFRQLLRRHREPQR